MKNYTEASTILWDFDGVLLDSMSVRDKGFELVLADYSDEQVQALLDFHRQNGGLSRYVKFKYFIEEILGEKDDPAQVRQWADKFSEIMLNELGDPSLLINDTVNYVKNNHSRQNMHIVSGSDGNELRQLCERLHIAGYFKTIQGSPVPKKELVAQVISDFGYNTQEMLLIGDSINDYEAAVCNNILFAGYNNESLSEKGTFYIPHFS